MYIYIHIREGGSILYVGLTGTFQTLIQQSTGNGSTIFKIVLIN